MGAASHPRIWHSTVSPRTSAMRKVIDAHGPSPFCGALGATVRLGKDRPACKMVPVIAFTGTVIGTALAYTVFLW